MAKSVQPHKSISNVKSGARMLRTVRRSPETKMLLLESCALLGSCEWRGVKFSPGCCQTAIVYCPDPVGHTFFCRETRRGVGL
jgi:hypothetical protein